MNVNVQLSVILWTIICFSLMMIILHNLLFRPVLKLLDQRKERLAAARRKKAEHEKLLEENALRLEEQREENLRRKKAEAQAAVDEIRAEEKVLLKEAHKECLQRIDVYRNQREKELEQILDAVSPEIAQVADLFVQRIVSHKD